MTEEAAHEQQDSECWVAWYIENPQYRAQGKTQADAARLLDELYAAQFTPPVPSGFRVMVVCK